MEQVDNLVISIALSHLMLAVNQSLTDAWLSFYLQCRCWTDSGTLDTADKQFYSADTHYVRPSVLNRWIDQLYREKSTPHHLWKWLVILIHLGDTVLWWHLGVTQCSLWWHLGVTQCSRRRRLHCVTCCAVVYQLKFQTTFTLCDVLCCCLPVEVPDDVYTVWRAV